MYLARAYMRGWTTLYAADQALSPRLLVEVARNRQQLWDQRFEDWKCSPRA